jgi:hypothetical protein
VYVPSHRYSRHYVERVNVSNTIVNRMFISQAYEDRGANFNYRNRVAPGGVTTAPRAAFTTAGRIAGRVVRTDNPGMAQAPASTVAPQFAPSREGRLGGTTRTNPRRPPQSVVDRQVVVRRDPPAAAARFARSPAPNPTLSQAPERADRPAFRGQVREVPARSIANDVVVRDRQDRPPRAERPVSESAPPVQSSVFDRRTLAERVRVDRDRQVREGQQREVERQQREASFAQREQQQQTREPVHRQPAPERSAPRERDNYRQRVEQPRVEQPRAVQPRVEQPRVPQPRVEQPRAERPQAERPSRSDPPKSSDTKSDRQDRSDRHSHGSR